MNIIARLLYAVAVILFLIGLLVLLNVVHRVNATWVGLWVGAVIAAILAYFLDSYRGRSRI
jgi:hypothetical protein